MLSRASRWRLFRRQRRRGVVVHHRPRTLGLGIGRPRLISLLGSLVLSCPSQACAPRRRRRPVDAARRNGTRRARGAEEDNAGPAGAKWVAAATGRRP